MSEHKRFDYASLEQVTSAAAALGLDLPASADVGILGRPFCLGIHELPNRLCAQPMEGCDSTPDGGPSDLTYRKYERFAAGGCGLIWLEAVAVTPEGRANPRQLWLHEGNVAAFAELVRRIRQAAPTGMRPVVILQLTHSGRYAKPEGKPAPLIAHRSLPLDGAMNLPPDHPLVSDSYLDDLQDRYVATALLAKQAGFDGVDVKACHRYLISELLASHTRAGSRYGGDFVGRTRMLRQIVAAVRCAVGQEMEVTTRMNVYDGLPYPWGWGVKNGNGCLRPTAAPGKVKGCNGGPPYDPANPEANATPDMAEPIRLVGELIESGLTGLSVTMGNPRWRPHMNRPSDRNVVGGPSFPEHPLEGVARMMHLTRQLQQAHPRLVVVGAGYSWLRQFFPNVAAAAVAKGWVSVVGLGRGALAYPDYARELLATGKLTPEKLCVACSACSQIMRDGGRSGCVVRDSAIYGPIYAAGRKAAGH